ncbi:translation initiation factor SUI1-related protein [Mangrovimonas yunxiaonensis]|uniref:Translation initiation factor SUI1-related protein n=1 Tax=Mangrovimonas yunxiaonensis TaxID=1197477 RepID=A0A084THF8_9FLAO|nr:translation initiation factor [Mangrovimonas yunxiaonensis]KFB00144.1 translation initiation factor SUI1-related protein [Mangrovimonas yunxiaonensis]GGH42129.1 translation initiation factor [Mangrovimonas yunxiaonensis]
MDLQDQLKQLFPDHVPEEQEPENTNETPDIWLQDDPIICKYEKRKGKPVTILEGYNGAESDFKQLAKTLKTKLSVGGSFKNNTIIIQGDYRDQIMAMLKEKGFSVKRVGG